MRSGFTDEPVSEAAIAEIVECGLAAPSSKNAQPWRVHVVADRQVLRELADAVQRAKAASRYVPLDPATGEPRTEWKSTVVESAQVLRQVTLGLFVENIGRFSSGRHAVAQSDHREQALVGYSFELLGIGAMVENMWLAAHAQGLRGVFMGDVLVAESAIRRRLQVEGDLVGVLALGHSRGAPAPKRLESERVVWH